MMSYIARPFGWLLLQLYELTANYGIAVILFALIVKVILLPFQMKSKKSMLKTSRLQPKMKELQKKHGANQQKYNEEHGITPTTIKKAVREAISISKEIAADEMRFEKDPESMTKKELEKLITKIDKQMRKAAAELNFELAAELRDKLRELKLQSEGLK